MALTWKYESVQHHTMWFPFCQQWEYKSWNMTLESDEALMNVFLYVDSAYSSIIEAKRSDQTNYRLLGVYSKTPSCYLGNLTADTPITINFRMRFTYGDTYIGEQVIPVKVGHGDDISPMYTTCQDTFWWAPDEVSFWNDDATDDFWIESCIT